MRESDWSSLDSKAARIFKEKQPFERLEVSKENLKKMFAYSKYKLHYINNLVEGEFSTVYKCGSLVDLCRGPHIQNTGKIKTMKIMQVCKELEKTSNEFQNEFLIFFGRILPHTFWVIKPMMLFNGYVVSPFLTKN